MGIFEYFLDILREGTMLPGLPILENVSYLFPKSTYVRFHVTTLLIILTADAEMHMLASTRGCYPSFSLKSEITGRANERAVQCWVYGEGIIARTMPTAFVLEMRILVVSPAPAPLRYKVGYLAIHAVTEKPWP